MKNKKISEGLIGMSVAALLIGLTLFGLALGSAASNGIAMQEHMLFTPALVCMAAGVLNLMLLILSPPNQPKKNQRGQSR